jgi:signal transduction histidine kinase
LGRLYKSSATAQVERAEAVVANACTLITEHFASLATGSDRRNLVDGTGLGLAIARELVDSHGGTLQLADRAPGTTLVIWLPVASG